MDNKAVKNKNSQEFEKPGSSKRQQLSDDHENSGVDNRTENFRALSREQQFEILEREEDGFLEVERSGNVPYSRLEYWSDKDLKEISDALAAAASKPEKA